MNRAEPIWWKINAGDNGELAEAWLDNNIITLGWNFGDFREQSPSEFRSSDRSTDSCVSKLLGVVECPSDEVMRPGDYVIVYAPEKKEIVGIARVGEAEYTESPQLPLNHRYRRNVRWLDSAAPISLGEFPEGQRTRRNTPYPASSMTRYRGATAHLFDAPLQLSRAEVEADISVVPKSLAFEVGDCYFRKEIHQEYGGQHQTGISTPEDEPFIFAFADPESDEYDYADGFDDGRTYELTGEGQTGDQKMERGNRAIRDHREEERSLHLFERVREVQGADVHSYLGEYEYMDHYPEPVESGDSARTVFRFKLAPLESEHADISAEEVDTLPMEEVIERARRSGESGSRGDSRTSGRSGSSPSYPSLRSEPVKRFARRAADGVCQGCEEDAPFVRPDESKFLEVHHITRRADGGADKPMNVIALCPNCHSKVHNGKGGDEFNQELKSKARELYRSLGL